MYIYIYIYIYIYRERTRDTLSIYLSLSIYIYILPIQASYCTHLFQEVLRRILLGMGMAMNVTAHLICVLCTYTVCIHMCIDIC